MIISQKVRKREFVTLRPSPPVILSEAKDLAYRLRINSTKGLVLSETKDRLRVNFAKDLA